MFKALGSGIVMSGVFVCLAVGSSQAQDWSDGLYLKAVGGLSFTQDDTADRGTAGRSSVDFETGIAAGSAIGYEITDNVSAELEFIYRSADVDRFGNAGFGTGDDFSSTVVTLNALYQMDGWDIGVGKRLRPFAGIGLGVTQEVDLDILSGSAAGDFEGSGDFVYQLRAGANFEVTDAWILSSELRYMDAGSVSLSRDSSGPDLEIDYQTVDLLFGIAYRF